MNMREMNLPNKLTCVRVVLIPFFVAFMLNSTNSSMNQWIALAVFVIAGLTDWLDGYLARKDNLVTVFGKFMDPLADKLLVCSALICFVQLGRLSAWIVIIIISREFIISGIRLIASDNGVVIAASYFGKAKTVAQMVMIVLLIADFGGVFVIIEGIFIYAALILTIISLADYIVKNKKVLNMQN
jgi:CDP-diacylglycerol---glycerol-3-phosphate 3-phosphatidyltransferase